MSEENKKQGNEVIDFGKILRKYLHYWWVFLISLIVCLGLGYFYIHKKSPVYLISGLIMLNQQEEGGVSAPGGMTAMLASFGMGGGSGDNPENEQMKIMSHTNLTDVVNKLGLQQGWWQDNGFFSRRANFYKDAPFKIEIPKAILDTISTATFFQFETDGKTPLHLTVKQAKNKVVLETDLRTFPYRAKTPYGTFNIDTTSFYMKGQPMNVRAVVVGTPDAVGELSEHLAAIVLSNKAEAIQIDMDDANVPRAEDIVNTVIDNYNDRRLNDRLTYNREALDFIESRLINLYNELEASESKIEHYKKNNKIVDATAEAEYIFARKGTIEANKTELDTRVQIYEMVSQMLRNPDTQHALIPFTGGQLGLSESYYKLIEGYNNLILERMQLSSAAKPGSTQLTKMDQQIDALRSNILSSVDKELQGAKITLAAINSEQGQSEARMGQIPQMEHELVVLYRDREVKNQIYAYLLQKREETQIQLAQHEPVAKVIDYAHRSLKPITPKPLFIYGAAILMGLLIPASVVQILNRRRKSDKKK